MDASEEDPVTRRALHREENTRQSRICLERIAKRHHRADTPENCEPEDAGEALQLRAFKMAKIEANDASHLANAKANPEKQQAQATKPANDTVTELNAPNLPYMLGCLRHVLQILPSYVRAHDAIVTAHKKTLQLSTAPYKLQ